MSQPCIEPQMLDALITSYLRKYGLMANVAEGTTEEEMVETMRDLVRNGAVRIEFVVHDGEPGYRLVTTDIGDALNQFLSRQITVGNA